VGAGVQLLIFWGLVLGFLFWEWNKLHLLWIAPLSFLGTLLLFRYFWTIARLPTPIMILVLGLLSPLFLLTRVFLAVLLVGIEKPPGYYLDNVRFPNLLHFLKLTLMLRFWAPRNTSR